MIDIKTIKDQIEEREITASFLIFSCSDNRYIAYQYINAISSILGLKVEYLEDLPAKNSVSVFDIFGTNDSSQDDNIRVYSCELFDSISDSLSTENKLFIVADKVSKESKEKFSDYIVEVPKIELWHIKDFVYSALEGVPRDKLDWLIKICNNDIYRISNEVDKLKMFSGNEQKYIFDDMVNEGCFSDLSTYNVFNITNAVTGKDINLLHNALREIKNFDAEPLGVVTLLYQGFKKLMQVWLSNNPTPENTGLKSNVIYAINKSPRVYSKQQLLSCFETMTDIDRMLKTGELCEMKYLIDYVVCKVLCM